MNLFLLFFQRYLFSNRGGAVIRTMARLCWVATLIGVFSLVVVFSIMNGFNRSIHNKLLSVEPHISVQWSKTYLTEKSTNESVLNSEIEKIKKFYEKSDEVIEISDFYKQDIILRSLDGRFSAGIAKGLDVDSLNGFIDRTNRLRYKSNAKNALTYIHKKTTLTDREIIIGSDLARELNLFEGDELLLIAPESLLLPSGEAIKYSRVKVAQIFTTEFSEIDSRFLFFQYNGTPPKFDSEASHVRGLELRLKYPDNFESVKTDIISLVGEGRSFTVQTWAESNRALFLALKLEKVAMTTFLSLSILITCFSLITVLVMLISQKRKEIGLLMSIGLSARRTKKLFLALGLFLSGLGLFGGLFLGLAVSFLINKYPVDILPDIYYDSSLPSEINFVFIAWTAIFCLGISFLAAYLPVRIYMRFSPSENLRLFAAE